MSAESPKQYDMFSGELVDNRTSRQRRADRQRDDWQQLSMFKLSETYQPGVTPRPWLNEMPRGTLMLEREDHRTPEEIETDLLREAQKLTVPMFEPSPELPEPTAEISPAAPIPIEGLRAQMRRAAVRVRRRVHAVSENAPQSGGG